MKSQKEETPEKPDFEKMANDYFDEINILEWPGKRDCYKAGMERIWRDYYIPVKGSEKFFRDSLDEAIIVNNDNVNKLLERDRELSAVKEENERLKETIKHYEKFVPSHELDGFQEPTVNNEVI